MQAVFLCEQFMEGTNKYALIYADPAWSYDNKGSRAKADNHYPTMSITDLKRLPVWDLAADDAILAMWWVPPMPLEAIQLAEAWGFKVKNMCLFSWHKLNKLAEKHIDRKLADWMATISMSEADDCWALTGADILTMIAEQTRMGLGNYTRSNVENVLVAVKGKGLPRLQADIKQMVMAPIGEHSVKPAEIREALEKLYGDVKRIELFSRSDAEGWDHWGNEAPSNSVELRSGVAIIPANDNEPATSPLAALTDELTWLVRETKGIWSKGDTHIALCERNRAAAVASIAGWPVSGLRWFTRAQYLERKAELQNKPSWKEAPVWAMFLIQTMAGFWLWLSHKPNGMDDNGVMSFDSAASSERARSGFVIGDWRDTLERRPTDLTIQQAGGAA